MATVQKPHHSLPGPHLGRPGEVVRGVLQASRLLPLVGRVCLVRFVELSQELDLRHQGVDLGQHSVIGSQLSVIVPNLKYKIKNNPSCSCKLTCMMSSLSLGDTDSPQMSSPLARSSSNCSPIAARSNSFHTRGVSCFLHLTLQVPPLQMWGSSHRGCLSSLIRW